jgi:hypothetical protein
VGFAAVLAAAFAFEAETAFGFFVIAMIASCKKL